MYFQECKFWNIFTKKCAPTICNDNIIGSIFYGPEHASFVLTCAWFIYRHAIRLHWQCLAHTTKRTPVLIKPRVNLGIVHLHNSRIIRNSNARVKFVYVINKARIGIAVSWLKLHFIFLNENSLLFIVW